MNTGEIELPLNEQKIISIILEQSEEIDERCDGYRTELIDVIGDILLHERNHRASATTIQQNINNSCNAAGRFLATQREKKSGTEEMNS